MLLAAELRRNVTNYQQGQPLDLSAETAAVLYQVLDNYQKDIELTSLILTLPKAIEFAELFKTIDPDAISAVREFMAQTIADNLKELLLQSPIKNIRILGFDPGFRNGSKLACIDENRKISRR